jgi:hypothetical protein
MPTGGCIQIAAPESDLRPGHLHLAYGSQRSQPLPWRNFSHVAVAEHGHDGVADELVDGPFVPFDLLLGP